MYGLLRPLRRAAPDERFDQRADMCSLCDALHLDYGITGRALNNYDAIFLATLTAAQNPQLRQSQLDPVRGACTRFLKAPSYRVEAYFELAANVSVLIAALRLGDSLTDEAGWVARLNPKRKVLAKWLKPRLQTALNKAANFGLGGLDPRSATARQKELETRPDVTIDELSQVTAEWLSEILAATARVAGRRLNEQPLRELGYALGRRIYIFDALDDMDDDIKSGDFNALLDTGEISQQFPRKARYEAANRLGQELLAASHWQLDRLLSQVTLEDNSTLVHKMLLDNRLLLQIDPELLLTNFETSQSAVPVKSTSQPIPLIQRTISTPANDKHTCKSKPHRIGLLGIAIGLAALPLQADACDCCCDLCAAEGDAACCCFEIELCSCCCNGCGGGGGRGYRRGRGPYYNPYSQNYPPQGYGPPPGGPGYGPPPGGPGYGPPPGGYGPPPDRRH